MQNKQDAKMQNSKNIEIPKRRDAKMPKYKKPPPDKANLSPCISVIQLLNYSVIKIFPIFVI
jgi:hypothetical protein